MSIIDSGRYRLRKDWASASIPSLVDIEERGEPEHHHHHHHHPLNASLTTLEQQQQQRGGVQHEEEEEQQQQQQHQKAPRRSSLALSSLFSSSKTEQKNSNSNSKRRSSIAISFLRRDKNSTKDSYESVVRREKSDGSCTPTNNADDEMMMHFNPVEHNEVVRASSPNEPGKLTYFDDGTGLRPIVKGIAAYESPTNPERNRRRRSSLQTKLDRRRRKNFDIFNQFGSLEPGNLNGNGNGNDVQPQSQSQSQSQHDLMTNDDGMLANANGAHAHNSVATDWQLVESAKANTNVVDDDAVNPNHAAYYPRQKRHSWWNIFVPEKNIKSRSRRASQDASTLSRSVDNLAAPVRRSKSRSVDHGLAAPFDLDSLRSKVEGRFESVDRLSKQKSSLLTIPTKSYTVGNRDTLTSVAARFDTTPSELTHLNRLNSSFIYPGQQLLVPDKSAKDDGSQSSSTAAESTATTGASVSGKSSPIDRNLSAEEKEKDLLEGLRPASPKPGHIERIAKEDDPVITQRFLKISVRHITDGQGVVSGVLLVTPNGIMFDPNVSDPLVIEHGPEAYGVIAPMELVVNAAIFYDIAHMRVAGNNEISQTEKPEIYYPKPVLFEEESKEEVEAAVAATPKQRAASCNDAIEEQREPIVDDAKHPESTKSEQAEDKATAKTDTTAKEDDSKKTLNVANTRSTLEERRKSLLDHHWAIPSKDRSSEDEGDNESNTTADSSGRAQDQQSINSSVSGTAAGVNALASGLAAIDLERLEQLSKESCYDSGIDIREAIPNIQPIPKKEVYSDADIVLSSDWVPPKTIVPTHYSESPPRNSALGQSLDVGARKKTPNVSFSIDDNKCNAGGNEVPIQSSNDKTTEKKNKMLKRLSYPLTWVEGLTGDAANTATGGAGSINKSTDDSAPNTGDSNQSVFSKVFSRRSSIGTFIRPHSSDSSGGASSTGKAKELKQQPKLDYRSMVSMDDKPELFISVDKLLPRPARACPDPPLYLRLRMGKPIGKAIPLPSSVMSYGKNKLRPEYWFSVPKNRIDELYRFINTWKKHLYGELDEEQIRARGFELIQDDTEWTKSGVSSTGAGNGSQESEETSDLTRESWEVLSMSTDEYRKSSLFATGSFDLDFPIPDLIGTTEILTEEHREKLCGHLPARAEGYSWTLVFSTSQHGFALNSLYRKMARLESPVLIVIQDTDNNVFGALTSCSLHVSDHFYGTGESLLYKFNPSFKVFHWTGENMYFIKGNMESLSIGAGDGHFGLWLDSDLNQGRSQSCSTYDNEPLAPQEDFVIKTLECWAFV